MVGCRQEVFLSLSVVMFMTLRSNSKKSLTISIVSWNTKDLTRNCIKSIYEAERDFALRIIVVDNNSSDGSAKAMRKAYPEVLVLENETNKGFAAANNQALAVSDSDFFLLLNPDTIVNKDSLKDMLDFLVHHVTVGAVGPRLVYPDGSLQKSYSTQFPSLAMILSHHGLLKDPDPPHKTVLKKPMPVACLMGACLMLRRRAIEDVGPMDEAFFLIYEEADWCYRLNKSGWLVYYLPQSTVVHYQGQSEKLIPGKGIIETQVSLQYYLRKHYGILTGILGILLMISIHSIWFIKNEIKALIFGDSEQIEYRRTLNKYVLLGQILAIKHFLSSIMNGSRT